MRWSRCGSGCCRTLCDTVVVHDACMRSQPAERQAGQAVKVFWCEPAQARVGGCWWSARNQGQPESSPHRTDGCCGYGSHQGEVHVCKPPAQAAPR